MTCLIRGRIAITFLCLFFFGAYGEDTCAQSPEDDDVLSRAMHWFPSDTETIIVANEPFVVPDDLRQSSFTDKMRSNTWGLITLIQDGEFQSYCRGTTIRCAIEASRKFTLPADLGLAPFEGCQVVVFDEVSTDAFASLVDHARGKAESSLQLRGLNVAVFSETLGQDEWTFFIANPEPRVLLVATDQEFLEEVLGRMEQVDTACAFPQELPEWEHVDVESPLWGVRHYRSEFAETDPTSPLSSRGSDSNAIGFAFWVEDEDCVVARYITGGDNASEFLKDDGFEGLDSSIEEVEQGVVEARVSVFEDNEAIVMLVVLYKLGHAIAL